MSACDTGRGEITSDGVITVAIVHGRRSAQCGRFAVGTAMKQYPEPKYWAVFTLIDEQLMSVEILDP